MGSIPFGDSDFISLSHTRDKLSTVTYYDIQSLYIKLLVIEQATVDL